MKPSELKELIKSRIQAKVKRALHIEGAPGLGKTEIPKQVAEELGIGFKVIHAPLLQPEDYGFPVVNATKTDVEFIASLSKFPLEKSDCPESGIFLIDELAQADTSAQKILANLIQTNEIHGLRLKAGWTVISTGNRTTDRAGANRLLGHLADRVTRMDLEVSLDDWTQWALNNHVKTEVIAFCRFKSDLLSHYDPQADKSPTPRGWVQGVSAQLGSIPKALEFETFKGDVGEGAAAEFKAFIDIWRELPSPDAIMANPDKHPVPEIGKDPKAAAILYALCGTLSAKASPDNFSLIMRYVQRMQPEFSMLFIRDSLRRCPAIAQSREYIAWASSDGAKLLS